MDYDLRPRWQPVVIFVMLQRVFRHDKSAAMSQESWCKSPQISPLLSMLLITQAVCEMAFRIIPVCFHIVSSSKYLSNAERNKPCDLVQWPRELFRWKRRWFTHSRVQRQHTRTLGLLSHFQFDIHRRRVIVSREAETKVNDRLKGRASLPGGHTQHQEKSRNGRHCFPQCMCLCVSVARTAFCCEICRRRRCHSAVDGESWRGC